MIEPFIQLASSAGSPARDSMFSFYLGSNLSWSSIAGVFKGHWLMLWASGAYMAVLFIGPLSSELLFLDMDWDCPNRNATNREHPCFKPLLTTNISILRALQGLLTFIAIMTIVIITLFWRTHTGLAESPSSIAAISTLAHHPDLLQDFRNIDTDASVLEVKRKLRHRFYRLQGYQSLEGTWGYGLVPFSSPTDHAKPFINISQYFEDYTSAKRKTKNSHKYEAVKDFLLGIALLALFCVIVAYYKESRDTSFNRFFNSNTFGPRFVMTAAGSITSWRWKQIERCKRLAWTCNYCKSSLLILTF